MSTLGNGSGTCSKKEKSLLPGFTFGGPGPHMTVGVAIRLAHKECQRLGRRMDSLPVFHPDA